MDVKYVLSSHSSRLTRQVSEVRRRIRGQGLLGLVLLVGSTAALAQTAAGGGLPTFSVTPAAGGGQTYSLPIQTLLFLTSLTFLPALVLMMTAFTRIAIVLSLLRQALGTAQAPPNQVLVGLSLFLTFFVMAPTFDRIYNEAYLPLSRNQLTFNDAALKASVPLKTFMVKQTRESDLALFVKLSNSKPLQGPEDISLKVLVPAFAISELKTAFQIGFVIFLPFLVIDMVVASVLMSMGMMMLSPAIVALPFKLMLFVLVDGWNLLIGSLVKTFG